MENKYLFQGIKESPKLFKLEVENLGAITDNEIIKEFLSQIGIDGMKRIVTVLTYYLEN